MNKALVVKKTIHIKVEPNKVWHALTDRETIIKYFFGTEAISDWNLTRTEPPFTFPRKDLPVIRSL